MDFKKEFLRDRRIYCGWSQEEFGKRVGVSKQAVQKWESGEVVPREKRLQKISDVLNARIAELSGEGNLDEIKPDAVESFRIGLIRAFIKSGRLPAESLKIALEIIENYPESGVK